MFDTVEEMIAVNERGITALNQVLGRLNRLKIGAVPEENSFLEAEINRTVSQINLLHINNAHLEAAGVIVEPLSADAKDALLEAFHRVDQAIVQDAIIGAGIDTINDIFAAVTRIRTLTSV